MHHHFFRQLSTYTLRIKSLYRLFIYVLLSLLPILAILFIHLGVAFGFHTIPSLSAFEISVVLVTLLIVIIEVKESREFVDYVPYVAFVALLMFSLTMLARMKYGGFDFDHHIDIAQAILRGENPYEYRFRTRGSAYPYSPFFAYTLAVAHSTITGLANVFTKLSIKGAYTWEIFSEIGHIAQIYMISTVFILCYIFGLRLGFTKFAASGMSLLLLIINRPIIENYYAGNVNMLLLIVFLFAIVYHDKYAILTGILIGITLFFKPYVIVFAIPFVVLRRWKLLSSLLVSIVTITVYVSEWGTNWTLWWQYIEALTGKGYSPVLATLITPPIQNQALYSIVFNTLRMLMDSSSYIIPDPGYFTSYSEISYSLQCLLPVARIIQYIFTAIIVIWFGYRAVQREKACRKYEIYNKDMITLKNINHIVDAGIIILLLAPTVWLQVYVLVIPLIFLLLASYNGKNIVILFISIIMTTGISIMSLYPFCYHPYIGLLMLVVLNNPCSLCQGWIDNAASRLRWIRGSS